MHTIDEAIEILEAMKAGKTIQIRVYDPIGWADRVKPHCDKMPDFLRFTFRVKPEPIEFWVNAYPEGYGRLYTTKEEALKSSGTNYVQTIKLVEAEE